MTLGELIGTLGGTLVHGDASWTVDAVNAIEKAGPFDVAFAETPTAVAEALACNACVVVLKPGAASSYPEGKNVIEADQPKLWFARAAKLLAPMSLASGAHKSAIVSPDAILGPLTVIGAGAVVGTRVHLGLRTHVGAGAIIGDGVQVGEDCVIHARAVLYPGTTVGNRVIVHAGAVLGADGFGYVRDNVTGEYAQFPQQGTLVIEDDVEIGANSTIDRGALEETRIRRGTKIDNLVHVGHNCDIGEDVILVALTGVSGSCTVGNGAVIAGQVGLGDHVTIGPGVVLGGQAGVFNGKTLTNEGVKPGTVFFGTPARPLRQVLREQATLARLAKKSVKEPAKEAGE